MNPFDTSKIPDMDKRMAALAAFNEVKELEARIRERSSGAKLRRDDYGRGDPVMCSLSGVPLLDDDETVYDEDTDEVFLRSALGLPPRPAIVDNDETEEEEIEEAA